MILEGAEFVKHDGIIEKQISEEGKTHKLLLGAIVLIGMKYEL